MIDITKCRIALILILTLAIPSSWRKNGKIVNSAEPAQPITVLRVEHPAEEIHVSLFYRELSYRLASEVW